MASRFAEVRPLLIASTAAGLSLPDAATRADMPVQTVKSWINKGKKGVAPYADFVSEIETARHLADEQPRPMTWEETLLAVSNTARRGNVQAMRLYVEMLNAASNEAEAEQPADPLEWIDQLATRRQQRAA